MRPNLEPLAVAAGSIALLMTVLYLWLVLAQGGDPAVWAVAMLVVGGVGALYGAPRRAPYRRVSMTVSAVLLGALGYLAILTVGMPLLLAAALCVAAVLRGRPAKDWRDTV